MASKGRLTLFPEGTTSDGTGPIAFKSSLLSALEPLPERVAVQPVALCYGEACAAQAIVAFARGESFLGNFARLLGEPARPVRVCFLEPILHAEHAGRRAIAQTARERVAVAMARA